MGCGSFDEGVWYDRIVRVEMEDMTLLSTPTASMWVLAKPDAAGGREPEHLNVGSIEKVYHMNNAVTKPSL